MARRVSVIVPVYADWDSLSQCIDSLKRHVGYFSRYRVYFVNDCGPEADKLERKILAKIRGRRNFFYHRNPANMGFLKNCNHATFQLVDQASDVLLLNSDTIVTKGFIQQIQAVLYAEPKIAAVCPRSNAATIFSVPMVQDPTNPVPADESYREYEARRATMQQYYLSPIAHGFCIMVRREVIDKYGLFDEVYGRGYGEENDFCMRVRREGWSCAVANWAYVFHMESRSFGSEERQKLVDEHEKILDERYPEYRQLVGDYVGDLLNSGLEH